jgi:hypothetical protein
MNIMIIDGGDAEASLVKQLIKEMDASATFRIVQFSLEDAIACMKDNGEPDIILLSLKQNGNASLQRLRTLPLHCPVFIHSGKAVLHQPPVIGNISLQKAAYFFADRRVNFMRTTDNKTMVIDHTMEELTGLLNAHDFFRINRSCIISYRSIVEIRPFLNNRLKLLISNGKDRTEEFVSKERVADFRKWLGAR